MKAKGKDKNPFNELTWSELEQWAGNRALSRGRIYQRDHRVQDLRKTRQGRLIAWVQGGRRYATQVRFEGGDLESTCDCPVGHTCKHAVAVVIEYLESVKKARTVPPADDRDERIEILEDTGQGDLEEDGYESFEHHQDEEADGSLEGFLREKSKEQVIALIKDLASRYPSVRESLKDGRDLSKGATSALVKSIRKEIRVPERCVAPGADGIQKSSPVHEKGLPAVPHTYRHCH